MAKRAILTNEWNFERSLMDCFAFCTASSYALKPLYEFLRTTYSSTYYRDLIHIELTEPQNVDIFFFSFGAMVTWGTSKEQTTEFLKQIAPFEQQPNEELEIDEFTYFYGDQAKIYEDEICLTDQSSLSKLAMSYAIAQSVKLGTFETSIHKTFEATKQLPEDLAKKGKILLSRREIRRKMGQLFIERNSINLRLDVLDTPEIFWEYPELEPLYKMAAIYLDINPRVEVLNHRLTIIHELLEMLGNELNHQHSSRLEWTIILLIVIEVILTISKDILKWI